MRQEQSSLIENSQSQIEASQPVANKKVKITFDEYQRLSFMIVQVMKEFETTNDVNIQQADIINKMVQKLEVENLDAGTSVERSIETSKKVANVIQYLVAKENILMVS